MGKNSFSLRDGEVQNITTRVKTYRLGEAPDTTFRTEVSPPIKATRIQRASHFAPVPKELLAEYGVSSTMPVPVKPLFASIEWCSLSFV